MTATRCLLPGPTGCVLFFDPIYCWSKLLPLHFSPTLYLFVPQTRGCTFFFPPLPPTTICQLYRGGKVVQFSEDSGLTSGSNQYHHRITQKATPTPWDEFQSRLSPKSKAGIHKGHDLGDISSRSRSTIAPPTCLQRNRRF